METLKEAFLRKFNKNRKILEYFEEANGCECTWENITKVRLQIYVDYLRTKLSPNGVKAYCSRLKTVLNLYSDEHPMPQGFEKVLNIRKDASENVYLTIEEVQRLIEYKPRSDAEWIIRNLFVIGCLTGARHSDYERFDSHNFNGENLAYVSIKTHQKTEIPLSESLKRIISESEAKGYTNIVFTGVYFNRIIKNICRRCHIDEVLTLYNRGETKTQEKWKYVTSHTARRTFATNLYLNGVDIYTISRLCGHSSVEVTKTYICCGPKVDNKVMKYFNNFK